METLIYKIVSSRNGVIIVRDPKTDTSQNLDDIHKTYKTQDTDFVILDKEGYWVKDVSDRSDLKHDLDIQTVPQQMYIVREIGEETFKVEKIRFQMTDTPEEKAWPWESATMYTYDEEYMPIDFVKEAIKAERIVYVYTGTLIHRSI